MDWRDNPKDILAMVQTMVLWIDNDYEDAGLKSRVKEIHGLLERLNMLLDKKYGWSDND